MAAVGVTAGVDENDVAEARAFNTQLEALIATVPTIMEIGAPESRRLRREGKGIFPKPVFLEEATNLEVTGRGGPIPLRVVQAPGKAIRLSPHIHGRARTLCTHDMQDV